MPTITSQGIGSGIDLQGIIDGLMAVERRPLEIIQFKREQIGVRISAYGELLSSVSSFNSVMSSLSEIDSLSLFKTFSGDSDVVEISATDEPTPGNYSVEVTRLAESHKVASGEILSSTAIGGAVGDELTVQVGADINDAITIDLSTAMTLESIRDAINEHEDNPGFTAAVINGDSNNQKLVITADETGSDNEITFSYGGAITDTDFNFATVNDISGDITNLNASLSIDGYAISRQTNEISDVIDGITIKLNSEDPGVSHILSVARDNAEVQKKVQGFSDAYNDLVSSINGLRNGGLASDSVLLSLDNQVRAILNSTKSDGAYSTLSEIGLSIQREGNMVLDAEKLQEALAEGLTGVSELLAADGTGFAYKLERLTDQWVGTDGLLNQRSVGLGEQIQDLDDSQLRIERNLQVIESRYVRQFAALDSLVASFQNTGNFLSSQLAQIRSISSDN